MRASAAAGRAWPGIVLMAGALAALAAPPASALDPSRKVTDYLLDFWQEDSGLPQKFVYVIHQTRDGYLWIGTRGGLARFDGVRFEAFDDRQAGQLQESEVISLTESTDGSLWIGTNGGGVSSLQDGRFTTYTTEHGLPSDFVPALAATPDGGVWIGTEKGLAHRKDGVVTIVDEGLPHRHVEALYLDDKGVLWIGTKGGLASMVGGRIISHAALHPATLGNRVTAVTSDGHGGLWIGLLGTPMPVVLYKDGVPTGFEAAAVGGSIVGISVDPQGTSWFASPSGLIRHRDGQFEKLNADVSGVSANHMVQTSSLRRAQTVFADREGSVWIGTPTDGLARLRDAVFTTASPRSPDGMEERVSAVFEDSQGALWMAMDAGGAARLAGGTWQLFDVLPKRSLDTFFEYPAGTMWTGSEEHLYRMEAGEFRPVDGPKNLGSAAVAADGTLWLGSKTEGLIQYRDGRFTAYDSGGQIGTLVRGLAMDSRGGLWIAAKDTGVACLRDGKVTRHSTGRGGRGDSAAAIYVDADDVAWAATRRGLVRIAGDQVTTFTAAHGLVANYFYQIVEDDSGHLWLTHGRGVARVSRRALTDVAAGKASTVDCQTFGTESGIKATTMVVPNQPAALKRRDGSLWFATGRGAAVVEPQALIRNRVPPPVWVEELRVDTETHRAEDGAVFPPGEGDVEIRYAGLSFIAPERVAFRYRLEGVDTAWIDAGSRRVAYYTKLPPGRYQFRVMASNNDGVWNETGHSVTFHLRPHWYQTGAFRLAMAALAVLAVAAGHKWRVREHRRRSQELARRVEEAVSHVKMLRGMLPICAGCKKIRDDSGYWNQMETYIQAHSEADFSHGMCPDCIARLYPDYEKAQREGRSPS